MNAHNFRVLSLTHTYPHACDYLNIIMCNNNYNIQGTVSAKFKIELPQMYIFPKKCFSKKLLIVQTVFSKKVLLFKTVFSKKILIQNNESIFNQLIGVCST